MKILVINGVDITPYIALKGYNFSIEDLDASAERSMSGTLTRDRVARVPIIEVTTVSMLKQADVAKIRNACKPARIRCEFYNPEVGTLNEHYFYAKIKGGSIYSTSKGYPEFEAMTISLKGFGGIW